MSLFLPTIPNPFFTLLHHPSPFAHPFFTDLASFPAALIQEIGEPFGPSMPPILSSLGCYTTPHFYSALTPVLSRVATYIDTHGPSIRNIIWLQIFLLLGLEHAQLPIESPPLAQVILSVDY